MSEKRKNIIKLENLEKKNIFSTPDHYFDELSDKINLKIQTADLSTNKKYKGSIFKAPEGYFENLPHIITSQIGQEEQLKEVKLKENIYGTPEGYFETLPSIVQNKISAKKKKIFISEWTIQPAFQYSLAAAVILTIVLIVIFRSSPEITPRTMVVKEINIDKILEGISIADINSYVRENEIILDEGLIEDIALSSKKEIPKIIEKSIPVSAKEKQQLKEEIELHDLNDLELDMEM
jgi:hypothetical protein